MRSQHLFTIIFLFFIVPVFSQQRLVICTTERNADNSISIFADSQISGDYTLKITFTSFAGYSANISSDVALITLHRGHAEVGKLTPSKTASMYALNYRYIYYPGVAMRRKPDTTFTYLLPGSENAPLRIIRVGSVAERIGQKTNTDFIATGFIYKAEDTICAARAGVVYDCNDAIKEGEKGIEAFRSDRNRINIQQRDGTLAHYEILAPIKLLVEAGDEVMPGQPIAVFNKESEKYVVLFSVSYLEEKKALLKTDDLNPVSPYTYLSTVFYADPTNKSIPLEQQKQYSAFHPKEIVGAELTKKEKKKLGM